MQKQTIYSILIFLTVVFFSSCEDIIDIDLNSSDPKVVIVADLNNEEKSHAIFVSKSVNFDDPKPNEPVLDAEVYIRLGNGKTFYFTSVGEGRYINPDLPISVGESYTLTVVVDGEEYQSTTTMLAYIEVDSIGVNQETIFNEDFFFVNFKFFDPSGQENYYRYSMSINGSPMKFNAIFSDKFNDGNEVTHQLGREDGNDIKPGDSLLIRRQIVTKEVYNYWAEYSQTNPGSAAPGNPTSNISNGALGYFSVSSVRDYPVGIDKASQG
ncbi:DUF4249 domain-containing protein [Sphingobacterium endophyticum]|uniref:DUF4249 domain-containing protein n=1 Tax=Sphingobacterium endophyticum TaxID=2546448 RepID=UPI0012E127A7|nr:DUF4249 domain-containing protein [Sphingobacterium endophyticum]